jgi:hypothetical protein
VQRRGKGKGTMKTSIRGILLLSTTRVLFPTTTAAAAGAITAARAARARNTVFTGNTDDTTTMQMSPSWLWCSPRFILLCWAVFASSIHQLHPGFSPGSIYTWTTTMHRKIRLLTVGRKMGQKRTHRRTTRKSP